MGGTVLGVDFGTSNTAAVLHRDGRPVPLLFDGSPLLPSAVFLDPAAGLLVGRDAERAAGASPERFEPNPKRRVDDGTVWLGEREVAVADAIGAVLHRVGAEAVRVAGRPVDRTVLTHPAGWGGPRMQVLATAAGLARLPAVCFVPEPVAAASYFTAVLGRQLPPGRCVVVYDFGAGTFDVAVVLRTGNGFEVLAADGLAEVGGLDLDAAVVGQVRAGTAQASQAWGRLDWPQSAADRRARQLLWQDARATKEQLSRHPAAALHVPLAEVDCHVTRDELEKLAQPLLERTVTVTVATLRAAGVGRETVSDLFLVGGSSRIPLAASMLHRALGIAPTVLEQPELVVAAGAPYAVPPPVAVQPFAPPPPAPPPPARPPVAAARAPVPPPSVPPAPDGRGAPLLRAAAWLALVIAVPGGSTELAKLLVSFDASDVLDWLDDSATRAVSAIVTIAVGGLVWWLVRGAGARAWTGAGLLLGYALLVVAGVLARPVVVPRLLSGGLRPGTAALITDLLLVVAAVLAAVALTRMPPPPEPDRKPPRAWVVTVVVAAAVAAVALGVYTIAYARPDGLPLVAVLALALPSYGVAGRPAALAVGALASWFGAALPLSVNIIDDWPGGAAAKHTTMLLFLAGTAVVLVAAGRCLAAARADA